MLRREKVVYPTIKVDIDLSKKKKKTNKVDIDFIGKHEVQKHQLKHSKRLKQVERRISKLHVSDRHK